MSITDVERRAVESRLKVESAIWNGPPDYLTFDRELSHAKLDQVEVAVLAETDADPTEVHHCAVKSHDFVEKTFDRYESKNSSALGFPIGRAFVVPVRSDRLHEEYASESRAFVPILDPDRFGVSAEIRMRSVYGYPPAVLDTYTSSRDAQERGALVLAPLYSDMIHDIRPDRSSKSQTIKLAETVSWLSEETARFAHLTLGAKVVGLGAVLPKITDYGRTLRDAPGMENMVTTTGHAGTVHMIHETTMKVLECTSVTDSGSIGVIGAAGAIGWASVESALSHLPYHRIYAFDLWQGDSLAAKVTESGASQRVTLCDSAAEVIRNATVIISATTSPIDLSTCDGAPGVDLSGKVIIDDSQPGCFSPDQVEERGGKLVWVVGEDRSPSGFVVRDGLYSDGVAYDYGTHSGIVGPRSEFACGQEAAVIAKYGKYDHAVIGPVSFDDCRRVGSLLLDSDIGAAPFQAFGSLVTL